ncbi:MAG: type I DNA topoisomerase [Candidatus Omnitrophica bacterium]|nr:type I DNA topoisomerase [Candidatus Omnitrophota bacterium]
MVKAKKEKKEEKTRKEKKESIPLVIVESPAKAKTINKIIGSKYVVESSMGHVMDLRGSAMSIDIENNFTPQYRVIPGRKKIINALKKLSKDKKELFLATDPDREGEAISWHLANLLGEGKNIHRVVFHEITPEAIKESFEKPTSIDMNKVNAQQARRILDRLVGYSLSPLLWKNVGRGLSAGRVQSVAVKLIVERDKEIKKFVPQEYWEIEADLSKKKTETGVDKPEEPFKAKLDKIGEDKAEIKNKEIAEELVENIKKEEFIVGKIEIKEKKRNPQAPFTTSKLQQEAFNKLHFSAQKTMKIAQELYEGLNVGEEGEVGLITYMRTDSVRAADSSIKDVRRFIGEEYGDEFLPGEANYYKSRKAAQEAHEAIRPTSVYRKPDKIKSFLSQDQQKLYELIWQKFVASQMNSAVFEVTSVDIYAGIYSFRASGSKLIFSGFLSIYPEDENSQSSLPHLEEKERLELLSLSPSQHFTKPLPRYTDASLVKALEEDGIGRPSTYAPIIQTIVSRDYVRRDQGYFYPTEMGIIVTELLESSFPEILDPGFTAEMEEKLDEIEEGKRDWIALLKDFYGPFEKTLNIAQVSMRNVKKEVVLIDEICEQCGRKFMIKWGRRGKFLSCSGYPECKNAKSITTGVKCPEKDCGGELVERKSTRGFFYGCTNYPKCTFTSRKLPAETDKTV